MDDTAIVKQAGGISKKFLSDLRLDSTRPGNAPTAHGFKQREDADADKHESQPQHKPGNPAAGDEQQRGNAAAHEASARINVGPEEMAHMKKLARGAGKR